MKKTIFIFSFLAIIFSTILISCDNDDTDPEQDLKVSSYTLNMDGITATELIGDIIVCPDGYFGITGKAPDGSSISISTGKILVNETRSICSVFLDEADFNACIDNDGFNIGGLIFNELYSPLSGTATRSNTNDITISGVLVKIDDLSEHTFTLEATASIVSPFNCE